MSKARKQPAALARAREARERARLEVRKVEALERIAAALEAANARRPTNVIVQPRERPPRTTLFDDELPLDHCGVRGCTAPVVTGLGWCERHRENPLAGVYDGG